MTTDPISRPSLADDAIAAAAKPPPRPRGVAGRDQTNSGRANHLKPRSSFAMTVRYGSQVHPRFATQQQAADYYAVTSRTVRNWISRGLITGYKLPGSRAVRVDLNQIDAVMGIIPTVAGDER